MFGMLARSTRTPKNKNCKHLQRHMHGLPQQIRSLLRETAQPVAVVTSFMPGSENDASSSSSHPASSASPFHGATLSSFTSISMAPHPLVAFALRVPSRMATSLSALAHKRSHSQPSHMIINLLSASQAHVALKFSRPDLHPHPFDELSWSQTREGLPILHGSLGALSCRVVGEAWPLSNLEALERGSTRIEEGRREEEPWSGDGVASELFIARVLRVEDVPPDRDSLDGGPQALPLLYHRQGYTTITDALAPSKKDR